MPNLASSGVSRQTQRRTERPALRLRHGSHHLQFAASDAAGAEMLGEQGFEIIAARHYDQARFPSFPLRFKTPGLYFPDGGMKGEPHAITFRQETGKTPDDLARVDRQFRGTPQRPQEAFRTYRRGSQQCLPCRKPGTVVPERRRFVAELPGDRGLVFPIGNVQRACGPKRPSGFPQQLEPDLAAAQGHPIESASRLPDGPDHPEVADGGSERSRAAFEHPDLFSGPRRQVGMGQSDHARPHHGHVDLLGRH